MTTIDGRRRARSMRAYVVERVVVVFFVVASLASPKARALAMSSKSMSMSIDAMDVDRGGAIGGTLIVVEGENFASSNASACAFDLATVVPVSTSMTTMVCVTPKYGDERGGFASVGVTLRRDGRDVATTPFGTYETFNYAKAMVIYGAYPSDANVHGGEIVYVAGAHLHETASVRWTQPATHVSGNVISSALVRCESPPLTITEISSMIIPTFAATKVAYDANVAATIAANQAVSVPPRSTGTFGFILNTDAFGLTSITPTSVNTTGGTNIVVKGTGFTTSGGADDGTFFSCHFGTIGPVDARITGTLYASCASPAHASEANAPFRLGVGNGRFILSSTTTITFADTAWTTADALYVEEPVSLVVMNPTLTVVNGAVPFDVVVGGSFFIEGSGMSFDSDDGCVCTYPGGTTSPLVFISTALARCTDVPLFTAGSGDITLSCSADINAVTRTTYLATIAVPAISSVNYQTISYQGGVALQAIGIDYPDEGESRSYSGCHFGTIGPVHARYLTYAIAECVTPALSPGLNVVLGFGATESQDLVQYSSISISVTSVASTATTVAPPLWLTPSTMYESAYTAVISVSDQENLGALSVGTLVCTFGYNLTSTGTASAPSVACPAPVGMLPGFTVVRLSRDGAAASLDAPAIILVKTDHHVASIHPRRTWGPTDLLFAFGTNFIVADGAIDPSKSLCVFSGAGASGGMIISSALLVCESPVVETALSVERWMAPCFESCSSSTGLPTGSTRNAVDARVSITTTAQAYLSTADVRSGWTYGGTPLRATLSTAVASDALSCVFGSIRVQARPAGVDVATNAGAVAQGSTLEIDCVSPARVRGVVNVYATLAHSFAPLVDGGISFTYR